MTAKKVSPKAPAKAKDYRAVLRLVQIGVVFLKTEAEQGRLPATALIDQLDVIKSAVDAVLGE